MICSLDELFTLFANDNMPLPPAAVSDSLFAETTKTTDRRLSDSWLGVISGLYTDEARNLSALPDTARRLFELSVNAFDAVIHAWMSELPVEPELLRFGRKTLAAPDRITAGNTAADRGDSDVHTVLKAADIVRHEVHRLLGFLRFNPGSNGVYTARCAPDHFTLPAFGGHFTRRFGSSPWAIIDEKRGICLWRGAGTPRLSPARENPFSVNLEQAASGEWENLWRLYHKTINNESRNNSELQRRFMPKRYRKYLPEL